MPANHPIHELIDQQLAELGICRAELARRCGFRNISKGVRRIDRICQGDLDPRTAKIVLDALPTALQVDAGAVETAVQGTIEIVKEAQRQAESLRDAAWRASFTPHGYLLSSATAPRQITFWAITGGAERWQRVPLELTKPPVTFVTQMCVVAKRTKFIQFLGETTGFVVNYTPDSAVRFDLWGNPVETLGSAYRPDNGSVTIRSRNL